MKEKDPKETTEIEIELKRQGGRMAVPCTGYCSRQIHNNKNRQRNTYTHYVNSNTQRNSSTHSVPNHTSRDKNKFKNKTKPKHRHEQKEKHKDNPPPQCLAI